MFGIAGREVFLPGCDAESARERIFCEDGIWWSKAKWMSPLQQQYVVAHLGGHIQIMQRCDDGERQAFD